MLNLPKLIAHRGGCGYAPENTLAAMRHAKQLGARWVEFDVMLSADGQAIIIHDDKVNRTTNGKGKVAELSYQQLSQLDAGSWFSHEFNKEKIPLFSEMIECLAETHLSANVEIKPTPGTAIATTDETMRLIKHSWPASLPLPIVSSFDYACIERARELSADIPLGFLMHRWDSQWLKLSEKLQCVTVHVNHHCLTEKKIQAIKASGKLVLAYTVNNAKRARELFNWGLDAIFTDYPDLKISE